MSDDRPLLSTARFDIVERSYRSPDGALHRRAIVLHPGAVTILPVFDDGRICLIRNFRPAIGRELFELPAGTLEPGEAPLATATRELEEETGYKAGKLEHLFTLYPSPGILDEKMHIFLATELTQGQTKFDDDEQITAKPFSFRDLRLQLKANNIKDGKTIAALGYLFTFKPWLGEEAK